jgi:hypothetical protein
MSPEIAKQAAKGIATITLFMAAVGWLFIFAIDWSVRPTDAELKEIDRLVMQRVALDRPECATTRLSSPGRVRKSGDIKKGYFTYSIRCGRSTSTRAVAKWLIRNGRVEITSLTPF